MKSLIKNCLFFVFKHEDVTKILFLIGSVGLVLEIKWPFLGILITLLCFCLFCLAAKFVIKELEDFDKQTGKSSAIALKVFLFYGFPIVFYVEAILFV